MPDLHAACLARDVKELSFDQRWGVCDSFVLWDSMINSGLSYRVF